MDEKDLFNRDAMYWREVNFSLPSDKVQLDLIDSIDIDGKTIQTIECSLLPFEAHVVEYELEDGGAFTKNEVKAWPFILISDLDFYNDVNNPEDERKSKLLSMPHSNVQAITIKDKSGNVVLKKERA